jgi:hypothetical protein
MKVQCPKYKAINGASEENQPEKGTYAQGKMGTFLTKLT